MKLLLLLLREDRKVQESKKDEPELPPPSPKEDDAASNSTAPISVTSSAKSTPLPPTLKQTRGIISVLFSARTFLSTSKILTKVRVKKFIAKLKVLYPKVGDGGLWWKVIEKILEKREWRKWKQFKNQDVLLDALMSKRTKEEARRWLDDNASFHFTKGVRDYEKIKLSENDSSDDSNGRDDEEESVVPSFIGTNTIPIHSTLPIEHLGVNSFNDLPSFVPAITQDGLPATTGIISGPALIDSIIERFAGIRLQTNPYFQLTEEIRLEMLKVFNKKFTSGDQAKIYKDARANFYRLATSSGLGMEIFEDIALDQFADLGLVGTEPRVEIQKAGVQIGEDGEVFAITNPKPSTPILNAQSWTIAFDRYKEIALLFYPARNQEFVNHHDWMSRQMLRYPEKVQAYILFDVKWRKELSNEQPRLHRMDDEKNQTILLAECLEIIASNSRSSLHPNHNSLQSRLDMPRSKPYDKKPKIICTNWNEGKRDKNCRGESRLHVCSKCSEAHRRIDCPQLSASERRGSSKIFNSSISAVTKQS